MNEIVKRMLWLSREKPGLVKACKKAGSIAPLLAMALVDLSADVHKPEDRAPKTLRALKTTDYEEETYATV